MTIVAEKDHAWVRKVYEIFLFGIYAPTYQFRIIIKKT